MNTQVWLANVAAYSVQVAVLIVAGAALVRLFRLKSPGVLLSFWQVLLVACLLLPAFQPWRQAGPRSLSPALPADSPALPGIPDSGPGAAFPAAGPAPSVPFPTYRALALLLAAGAALRILWLALGMLRLHRYRARSRRLAGLPDTIRDLQWRVGVSPEIFLSREIDTPVTFGWQKPAVLFPASFADMDEKLQRPIACHELLHVRRRDWLCMVLEELVRSLLWFHPAIRWALGRVHLSREQVVDREVLRVTGQRGHYLESLLHIASLRGRPAAVPAALLLKERHLVQRVALMLKESTMTKSRVVFSLIAITACLVWTGTYAAAWFPLSSPPAPEPVTVGAPAPLPAAMAPAPTPAPIDVEPARSAPAAGQQAPVRVDADVQAAKLLRKVLPVYPNLARQVRMEGLVELEVDINEAGIPTNIRVMNGHPLLDGAAMEAVRQWRYSRTIVNGVAIPVRTTVALQFAAPGGVEASIRVGDALFVPPVEIPRPAAASGQGQGTAPVRVGGQVQESKILKWVAPVYPEIARQGKMEAVVILEATVNEQGYVTNVRVIKGHRDLDQAAMDAVKQWEYSPTLLNGRPVPVVATVSVPFKLDGSATGPALPVRMDVNGNLVDSQGQPATLDELRSRREFSISPAPHVPFPVLEQSLRSLQSQGIPFRLSSPSYVFLAGRLFYRVYDSEHPGAQVSADPAIQPPVLDFDRNQLVEIARSSGRVSGAAFVLPFTMCISETGEIIAIQPGATDIPEIAVALGKVRVISPGRLGNQPIPTAVSLVIDSRK